jgi:hypothetical protein
VVQADALIVDLYMGSANQDAGFRWTVGGFWGAITDGKNDISGVAFNFTMIDTLAKGLHDAKVPPAPPLQPPTLDSTTTCTSCIHRTSIFIICSTKQSFGCITSVVCMWLNGRCEFLFFSDDKLAA